MDAVKNRVLVHPEKPFDPSVDLERYIEEVPLSISKYEFSKNVQNQNDSVLRSAYNAAVSRAVEHKLNDMFQNRAKDLSEDKYVAAFGLDGRTFHVAGFSATGIAQDIVHDVDRNPEVQKIVLSERVGSINPRALYSPGVVSEIIKGALDSGDTIEPHVLYTSGKRSLPVSPAVAVWEHDPL